MVEFTWYELHWPRPLPPDTALEMLRRLAAERSRAPFLIEAIGSSGEVRYRLGVPTRAVSTARQLFAALVPGSILDESTAGTAALKAAVRLTSRGAPIGFRTSRPIEATRSLLAALAAAREDETLVLQLFLGDGQPAHLMRPKPLDPRQGMLDQLFRGTREASTDVARRMRDKASEPGIRTMVRLGVDAKDVSRRHALLKGLIGGLRLAQSAGTTLDFVNAAPASFNRIPQVGLLTLTPDEIVGLSAWPFGESDLPGLVGLHPRSLRLSGPDFETDRIFAVTTSPGSERQVGLAIEDSLYHAQFIGPTGVGKSTLLQSLIVADMAAGRSVIVVDPKAEWVLQHVLPRVPYKRRGDVVILDPTHEQPLGLNLLSQPGRAPELIADAIVETFKNLFPSLWGPRTSDVLMSAVMTLIGVPGATLTWLVRLLTEPTFRAQILAQIDDEMLVSYWLEFDGMSAAQQAQFVGPVLSRLRQFLLRPGLRRVLDQAEPKFQLAELFSGPPKVLLVPLNSAMVGKQAASLLGSLLVAQLWDLTLARADVPYKERTPVSIYIDEAPVFFRTTDGDLEDALSRSRSFGVAWNLAYQFRRQFPDSIREALDGNARSRVVFQPVSDDAHALARDAVSLEPADFLALPRFHVYANLMRGGEPTGWFSARSLPPGPETSDPQQLIKRSIRAYGQGVSEQPKRAEPDEDTGIGRRRRSS